MKCDGAQPILQGICAPSLWRMLEITEFGTFGTIRQMQRVTEICRCQLIAVIVEVRLVVSARSLTGP